MADFICGPNWFYRADIIIEMISLVVAFLIAFFSYKAYNLTRERRYFFFALAFFLIGVSFVSKLYGLIFACSTLNKAIIGYSTAVTQKIEFIRFVYSMGYFLQRFIMLVGLLVLTALCLKISNKKVLSLLVIFVFIATWFSDQTYLIYHVIAAVLLVYISLYFYVNYLIKKTFNARLVPMSFFLLLASQIFFIFVLYNMHFYVLANLLQLAGFVLLLVAYILVVKK